MSGTIYGTGKKRRDDVLNRVMDAVYKGQSIPLGGNSNPVVMAQLMSSVNFSSATVIDLVNAQTGTHLITCNVSKVGDGSVCG